MSIPITELYGIVSYPHPALLKEAEPLSEINAEVRALAAKMADAMYKCRGIGLAAPQLGISVQMIVIDVGEGLYTLINPKIVKNKGVSHGYEGCLSFPGVSIRVRRRAEVTVQALNLDGDSLEINAKGVFAVCLQHEIDHLRGVTLAQKEVQQRP